MLRIIMSQRVCKFIVILSYILLKIIQIIFLLSFFSPELDLLTIVDYFGKKTPENIIKGRFVFVLDDVSRMIFAGMGIFQCNTRVQVSYRSCKKSAINTSTSRHSGGDYLL
jgi:hypothetical protein